jgi:Ni,Fe-hydrogenase III large subunit
MASLNEFIARGHLVAVHRPWPRAWVDEETWNVAADGLAEGRWTLLGLWGEAAAVHMMLIDETQGEIAVLSMECSNGVFPSIGLRHPPALRLERTIRDLWGLEPAAAPDARPWLDHGRWGIRRPLGSRPQPPLEAAPYVFLPSNGSGLHQIPVGPVHAGIIEPGHFRFTANGETIVRLEARLGYAHKGTESLMAGASLDQASRLAGRVSGDSTVAYAISFARAVEAALGVEVPARAVWLRALMAELERLANHLGDIGAICNDASFAIMHAHCGVLREHVLRAAAACFDHRLMMDCATPGGVAVDLSLDGAARIRALLDTIAKAFPALVELYDNTASLQDRTVGAGIVKPALVRQYGAGGYIGRASGRAFDVRRVIPYAPYDGLRFEVSGLDEGDVNARVWIRIREVEQSLSLVAQILDGLPPGGALRAEIGGVGETREGMALVEGFRGDILAWVRIDGEGRIARCHLRDPSWFQWPLIEAAIEGNIVADFPLCNKSFNCSYSGHDL